jgi:hypothetical protein
MDVRIQTMATRFEITRDTVSKEIDPKMILITFASTVLAFIVGLQWQNFVQNSIDDAAITASKPIPKSVASLISAMIISAIAVGGIYGLYIAAKQIVDKDIKDTSTGKDDDNDAVK